MAVTIDERKALEAFGRIMDGLGDTIAHGVHPNLRAYVALWANAKAAVAPGGPLAGQSAQYTAEMAEMGVTVAQLNGLATQMQNVVNSLEAMEATTGGRWFVLAKEEQAE